MPFRSNLFDLSKRNESSRYEMYSETVFPSTSTLRSLMMLVMRWGLVSDPIPEERTSYTASRTSGSLTFFLSTMSLRYTTLTRSSR